MVTFLCHQEFIDMCDFAVGLSRQLNGAVIPSEREIRTATFSLPSEGHLGIGFFIVFLGFLGSGFRFLGFFKRLFFFSFACFCRRDQNAGGFYIFFIFSCGRVTKSKRWMQWRVLIATSASKPIHRCTSRGNDRGSFSLEFQFELVQCTQMLSLPRSPACPLVQRNETNIHPSGFSAELFRTASVTSQARASVPIYSFTVPI